MITATVIGMIPSTNGRGAKVYARSPELVSPQNPDGEAMFYSASPFWTGDRLPYRGQSVLINKVEPKTSPYWTTPKWLAREVSPVATDNSCSPVPSQSSAGSVRNLGVFQRIRALLQFPSLGAPRIG